MIEFLTEYGMFLAKVITFVIALLFVVGGIAASTSKVKEQAETGDVKVRNINHELDRMKHTLEHAVSSVDDIKQQQKQKKKEDKKKRKLEKKAGTRETLKPRTYVLDFKGDIHASHADLLRNEISAVLAVANKDDEILLRLESPGGVVHGYGLAASQLDRIRKQGIRLVVAVDKVAASGGYMMACIADRIIAAPFAIIGSIGVVAQIPNFHRLLKKNNVDVELMTAGEYKRTLTMLGENTDKAREKFQEELEDTHLLFKDFVSEHRHKVDIDKVATGEHWFGTRARELGLVDELMTSDEYLLESSKERDMYLVNWELRRTLAERLGLSAESALKGAIEKVLMAGSKRWLQ